MVQTVWQPGVVTPGRNGLKATNKAALSRIKADHAKPA
jgi:hypothetical protein